MSNIRREWLEKIDALYNPTRRLARAGVIRLNGLIDDRFYYNHQYPSVELPQLLAEHFRDKVDMFVWFKWGVGLQYEFDRITMTNMPIAGQPPSGINARDPLTALQQAQHAQQANQGRRGGGRFANNAPEALQTVDEHLRGYANRRIVALFHQTNWDFPGRNPEHQNLVPQIMDWPKICLGKHLVIFSSEPLADWVRSFFKGSTVDLSVTGPTSAEIKQRLTFEYLTKGEKFFDWQQLDPVARFFEKTFGSTSGPNVGYHSFVVQQIENRGTTTYDKEFLDNQPTSAVDYHKIDVEGFKRHLDENIIGQDKIKSWAVGRLKELQVLGVPSNRPRPLPVIAELFAGPSGVGKSELARVIAKFVFDRPPLIIAGTEYQLEHEVAKLLGAPPGYVGFGPGELTRYLQTIPYGLILLDEFEKCHESLQLFFMNAMDQGTTTTPDGFQLNFGNTIVIATCNTGASEIDDQLGSQNLTTQQREDAYQRIIQRTFNNALLGRFEGIRIFDMLSEQNRQDIARLCVTRFVKENREAYMMPNFAVNATENFYRELLARCPSEFGTRRIQKLVESIMKPILIAVRQKTSTTAEPIKLDWEAEFPTMDQHPIHI